MHYCMFCYAILHQQGYYPKKHMLLEQQERTEQDEQTVASDQTELTNI